MKTEILESVQSTRSFGEAHSDDDPREMAPRAIALEQILVPLDFSETSMKSLQYAVAFARQFGAKITLLHVVVPQTYPTEMPYPISNEQEIVASAERMIERIKDENIPSELSAVTVVRHGVLFDSILDVARETRADLIVITTHGYTGLKHMLMGSAAESVVRQAPCPVLVVRECEHDFV